MKSVTVNRQHYVKYHDSSSSVVFHWEKSCKQMNANMCCCRSSSLVHKTAEGKFSEQEA